MSKPSTININGVDYVRADAVPETITEELDNMPYRLVRTRSAGVFAAYVKERNGLEATLMQARRLWKWSGAASLSELAMHGVKNPEKCQFPCTVDNLVVTEVIELLPVTEKAKTSINGVPVWTA